MSRKYMLYYDLNGNWRLCNHEGDEVAKRKRPWNRLSLCMTIEKETDAGAIELAQTVVKGIGE